MMSHGMGAGGHGAYGKESIQTKSRSNQNTIPVASKNLERAKYM